MLQKQPFNINFSNGVDTKTDPFQINQSSFLSLSNSVFTTGARLTKRNGFGPLSVLPDNTNTFLTTFNGDLTAIGTSLYAYESANEAWVDKGVIQPISLTTIPLIRSNLNQSQVDTAIALNGLVCTVYTDNPPGGPVCKYAIADSVTGQNIVAPTLIPASGGGTVTGSPRVFVLGSYFIVMFTNVITATSHLDYIAISTSNPSGTPIPGEITSSYSPFTTVSWDGVVYGNELIVAYNSTTGGQNISIKTLSNTLALSSPVVFAGQECNVISLTVDSTIPSRPIIWVSYFNPAIAGDAYAFAVYPNLVIALTPTYLGFSSLGTGLVSTAQNNILTVVAEIPNDYGYDLSIPTNYLLKNTLTLSGTVGTPSVLVRSVGLASKAFLYNGVMYFVAAYQSDFQPTYFLMNSLGQVISRFDYSNGGGYDPVGLPSVTLIDGIASVGYLIKDLISATNKNIGAISTSPVYSQTGLNLISFNMASENTYSTEIGSNLNLTGGFVSGYDGYTITEQNFFLWPDNVEVTTSTTGGDLAAQQYYYYATYEWADNAGNVFRSAPSIPVLVTTTGSTSSNTIDVPTLRLTYKTANPVKIVVYRWSTAQQIPYAIASPAAVPTLNNLTVDYVTIVDTLSDDDILGNPILYTNGGVIEDIAPPSTSIMTLFNNRLWLVDAEDTNLLWFSKQVIEDTPVEMSDLLTFYIAPAAGAQASTGPITALAPMDDKLIIFKRDALGFINGIGPDNTGANNGYSDFALINSVVGCVGQKSIVLTPTGLMFQSDKGIWLVGRDLSTNYIGAAVEKYTTGATVVSALNVPGTNQVRLALDSGITLMYDYYYNQWGTFTNVAAVASTVYNELHTYLDSFGRIFQETPGLYLDNTSPVLMSFTSAWLNFAGLQGYERFYHFLLLGQTLSPFKLNVQLAFDYNPNPRQATTVTPDSIIGAWGSGSNMWGNTGGSGITWGGPTAGEYAFRARIFPQIQKCASFQISINEIYDPSYGIAAGAGLTLSGMDVILGIKKGSRTIPASRSFG